MPHVVDPKHLAPRCHKPTGGNGRNGWKAAIRGITQREGLH